MNLHILINKKGFTLEKCGVIVWLIFKSLFVDETCFSYAVPRLILGLKIIQVQPNLYISNSTNSLLNNFIVRISANKFKTISRKTRNIGDKGKLSLDKAQCFARLSCLI